MANLELVGKRYLKSVFSQAFPVLIVLVLWEILGRAELVSALFFPAPSRIITVLAARLVRGDMLPHVAATLFRITSGFIIGAGIGLITGFMMGRWKPFRLLFDPIFSSLHPLPKITLFPLLIVIIGIGDKSRISVIALASFFPMMITVMSATRNIPQDYVDIARSYRAGWFLIFRKILWPACLVSVVVGIRLSINTALLLAVSVELISAPDGLGWLIDRAWRTYQITDLYAILIVIGIIGAAFRGLTEGLARFLTPWNN